MAIFLGIFLFLYCAVYLVGVGAACLLILAALGAAVLLDYLKDKLETVLKKPKNKRQL